MLLATLIFNLFFSAKMCISLLKKHPVWKTLFFTKYILNLGYSWSHSASITKAYFNLFWFNKNLNAIKTVLMKGTCYLRQVEHCYIAVVAVPFLTLFDSLMSMFVVTHSWLILDLYQSLEAAFLVALSAQLPKTVEPW